VQDEEFVEMRGVGILCFQKNFVRSCEVTMYNLRIVVFTFLALKASASYHIPSYSPAKVILFPVKEKFSWNMSHE
jgi:hypothetical protein